MVNFKIVKKKYYLPNQGYKIVTFKVYTKGVLRGLRTAINVDWIKEHQTKLKGGVDNE